MTAREITYIPLAELREDPRNPKAHDHGAITASLERFSVIDPIVIDGRTGYIISGHGRRSALLAMSERGDEPPEGVALADDSSWLVPAVTGWSSRTDTEARAALIALNRTGELGGWVDDSLLSLLDELSAADPDLPIGFGDEDREALRRLVEADVSSHDPPGAIGADAEEMDIDPSAEPITQPGDVWILGDHLLVCGDCRDEAVAGELALAGEVSLVLTDPPYGVSERTARGSNGRGGPFGGRVTNPEGKEILAQDFAPVHGDDDPFDPEWLITRYQRVILFGANHYADRLPPSPSWIIWDKLDGLTTDKRIVGLDDNADAELAWSNLGGPARIIVHRWKGLLKGSEHGEHRVHPTQKPIALMQRIIEWRTEPGQVVLDPYAGSGPVLLACEIAGRVSLSVEITPGYCDVVCRRWQQMTGRTPVLRSTGQERDFVAAAPRQSEGGSERWTGADIGDLDGLEG